MPQEVICFSVWVPLQGDDKILQFTFTAFSRRFYPKRLTVHSGYTFIASMCVPWELNPWPFVLLTQYSTTEPEELLLS